MFTRSRASILMVIAPIMIADALQAQSLGTNADVPVTKVVLFSSGVGYFEHAGTVRDNGSTMLRFKTSQINDILKSLVLQDQDGGRVGAITYPSQDPLAKTLRSFQIDVTQNPSLAELLNQLRGARVTVQVHADRVSGTIVGVETRPLSAANDEPVTTAVLNLLTGATIRAIDLRSIVDLSLDDRELQEELIKALSALAQARDQDKKPVTINFTGSGARRVRIGYVVESPIWKTSYRLLLDGQKMTGFLQGWAIVENQTESDWNGVSLALVSGRPISFMMDLYQPLYSTRPTVVQEGYANLRPQMYEAAVDSVSERETMSAAGTVRRRAIPARKDIQAQLSEVVVTAMDAASSVQSMAATMKLGELFQYTVGNVTLPRQKSAMLPIITDSVAVERLSIYNASVLRSNPLTGVRLNNTTGKHLLQGPITVFDAAGYAGDARIDNVPPGQQRLLSYGIDLDISVDDTRLTQVNVVQSAMIAKGVLYLQRKLVATQEYAADNKSDADKTLVIEHPIRNGWKLVDTRTPFETTPALYRFKGTATAHKVTILPVKEEWIQSQTVAMLTENIDGLIAYRTTNEIPQTVRDAIAKVIQIRQAMFDIERQIGVQSARIAEITAEQNRIRENMKTVTPKTAYYARLLSKLNEQESSIEKLQLERDTLTSRRDALRRDLGDYLLGLTVR